MRRGSVEAECGDRMQRGMRQRVDTRVTVETPEGVDFQFVIAGPGARAHAWLIDTSLKAAILGVVVVVAGLAGVVNSEIAKYSSGALLALLFFLDWFYMSLFEGFWHGQTPGKRSAGLRVVRTNGTPLDVLSAMGRNFLRAADVLPFCYTAGLISMLVTRRLQRLGDVFFDTMVIEERSESISARTELTRTVQPLPRSDCTRRFELPERTLAVIERLFDPDRVLSEPRREEIARPLSEAIRNRLGFTEPDPDSKNPYGFFQNQGFRHTQFLLRVLRTFAEVPRES